MAALILATKMYKPQPRARAVLRPRLLDVLNRAVQGKLTLVAVAAGFGKTTLLSQWLAATSLPSAWLALDAWDTDPERFWRHFVAALQTLDTAPAGLGNDVLALLQSPQPASWQTILPLLLNQLVAIPDDFVLVLDDYHAVESQAVDEALAFLLAHLPPSMHLVIATREDPNLPLARLRARGQLTELRAGDLRFTADEAAAFLRHAMGLDLAPEDVVALESRTEGWIAGLQLAALSLQGQTDSAGFIRAFSGTHRFVLDYLMEEVLQRQDEEIQTFLLRTAILDRLCARLCEAVAPGVFGQDTLEALEAANLFVVPLDTERRWYRYHHLFRELLRQRLEQALSASTQDSVLSVAELHRRASVWYEDNCLETDAFRHAVAAGDVERVERLAHGGEMPLHFRGAVGPVLEWLEALSPDYLDQNPALWVTFASAAMMAGQSPERIEEMMQAAERGLQASVQEPHTRDLLGHIATIRAMLAIPLNRVDVILSQSQLALDYLSPDNLATRTSAHWALGYVRQVRGERAAAIRAYTDAIGTSQAPGNRMITLAALTCLGQVQESLNQLHAAAQSHRKGLALFDEASPPFTCENYIGLARIAYAQNELATAEAYARHSAELAQQLSNVDTPVACHLLFARLRLAEDDVTGANAALDAAEAFANQHGFVHRLSDIAAARVCTLLHSRSAASENLAAAAHLAQRFSLPISQARVLIAQAEPAAALALLQEVYAQAEAKGWADQLLQAALLQAIVCRRMGDREQALRHLHRALALAEPGALLRCFVDEGPVMAELLTAAAAGGIGSAFVDTVLAVFPIDWSDGAQRQALPAQAQPLVAPLSPRELEVLGLIAQGLSNREIGQRLFLALDTVKGHNRRIFGKLGVQRRTEAVARARELHLL